MTGCSNHPARRRQGCKDCKHNYYIEYKERPEVKERLRIQRSNPEYKLKRCLKQKEFSRGKGAEYCKSYRKKYHAEHRNEQRARSKKYYYEIIKLQKNIVFEFYCNGEPRCMCCGEREVEFLTIDHINGRDKTQRKVTGVHFYSWLVNHSFPEGYQVLCWNCNSTKGKLGYCPHQKKEILPWLHV